MLSVLKNTFKIVNYNLLLTIPLIIFTKIFELYTANIGTEPTFRLVVASFTIMLMFAVFCSGWLYMVKGAVDLSKKIFVLDADRAKASMELFKWFFEGVGKFFLSFIGVYIIFFFIQLFLTVLTLICGSYLIGNLDPNSIQALQNLAVNGSNAAVAEFVNNMSPELLGFFWKWSLLFIFVTTFALYILMFWAPEIINSCKNPLCSLYTSIKKIFKNFWGTLGFYVVLWMVGFVLLFLNTFSMINPFVYLFMNLLIYYFYVYIAVAIFLYYNKKFAVNDEE